MAKNKISEWSATAANNTDIGGIDIAEGCAPSGINNAIRELMAQVKDQQTGTDADNFTVGGNLTVNGTAAFTSLSLTGNTVVGDTSADTLTVNATPTFNVAIPVTSGGTGVTTSTGTGAVVRAVSPSLTTPVLGTPASGTLTSCTGLPLTTGVTGTLPVANGGTGVTTSTGTGNNVLSTSPTLVTPVLGTPASGTLTSCTGLPVSTGISGLATGAATFLATPSSANLAAMLTDETGTGANVFANSPTLVTPALGTPSSGTLTNCTFPTLNQNTTGSSGSCTGNSATATLAATATNALACSGNSATATTATTATNVTNAIGQGQTWQTVTRSASTNYTNSTGKPIMVSLYGLGTIQLTIDGVIAAQSTVNNAGNCVTGIVPNGSVYSCNQAVWQAELR